jgi:hypothetical protein
MGIIIFSSSVRDGKKSHFSHRNILHCSLVIPSLLLHAITLISHMRRWRKSFNSIASLVLESDCKKGKLSSFLKVGGIKFVLALVPMRSTIGSPVPFMRFFHLDLSHCHCQKKGKIRQ